MSAPSRALGETAACACRARWLPAPDSRTLVVMEKALPRHKEFAEYVVRRLRGAGFTAYFAGGCVRDRLLGRTPTDYDVATNATPSEIRNLFGRRRTLAIGAAFGVMSVVGPKPAGQVEVATFRRDAAYSDGRHPDTVTFSSAEEDARRRDFTINGLFYDPVDDRVIDFVGGQADLARGILRAIGNAHDRFAEDKLRLLRAVRFAATFGFELEPETARALRHMAPQIGVVSPERIAMEMRRLLTAERRVRGVQLLLDTGLADVLLPEIVPHDAATRTLLHADLAVLGRLAAPSFPLALAALLHRRGGAAAIRDVGRRWRLANREADRAAWLVAHLPLLQRACDAKLSELQPMLVHEGVAELLALGEAVAPGSSALARCRAMLCRPPEELDPPPLIDGATLIAYGFRPGPSFSRLLSRVRSAQLDGEVASRDEALALIHREAATHDELPSSE